MLITIAIVRYAPAAQWMLPGIWQVIFSLGVFASCRFLPRAMCCAGAGTCLTGLVCIALADGRALSPWAMGIPYGVGQLLVAGILLFRCSGRSQMKSKEIQRGPFAYEGLDRVIHERARLSVLTSLITNPKGLTFNDLKQLCGLTDGNLSRHLQVLEKRRWSRSSKGMSETVRRPSAVSRLRGESAIWSTSRRSSRWFATRRGKPNQSRSES